MVQLIVTTVFIISVAMAAGSIILSSRLRNRYHHQLFSLLFYYEVFIFAFGFYGIWGQVILKAYLWYINPDILQHITEVATLLGLPFLVFAWLMLIRFSCRITDRSCGNKFIFIYLALNFLIITVFGYMLSDMQRSMPADLLKGYFIIMNFAYSLTASYMLLNLKKKNSILTINDQRYLALGIVVVMIIQCCLLLKNKDHVYTGLVFILSFFIGNSFLPVYLTYFLKKPFEEKEEGNLSFDEFCRRFEISPRETDIIREICNGLSNKEISEKLFISLQTVKDHTHRIYIKTNVRSRVQLMNLVKGYNLTNHTI